MHAAASMELGSNTPFAAVRPKDCYAENLSFDTDNQTSGLSTINLCLKQLHHALAILGTVIGDPFDKLLLRP